MRTKQIAQLIGGLAASLLPSVGSAACHVDMIAELPITMRGEKPLTEASINGTPKSFVVDSGAFYSSLSTSVAHELNIPMEPAAPGFRVTGIGGSASASIATVKKFGIAKATIPNVEFLVAGSEIAAGLLGQNVLGLADVEYDLEHGAVRLMKPHNCNQLAMAYWAGARPFSELPIDVLEGLNKHTIGTILINGVKVRATFDTGAANTVISLAAARRLGITPETPGVEELGVGHGIGGRLVRSWRVPIDRIDIAGELLNNAKIGMEELGDGTDMLVGIDFFLSHRVFVANSQHRMYFTYDGGPVFGITPRRAVTGAGTEIALTDTGSEPKDAAGYSARGTALASKRDFVGALADLDKAVAMAPGEARYWEQRSQIRLALHQPDRAADDLNKALALAPQDPDILMTHAAMLLARRDKGAAANDIHAADAALNPAAMERMRLASLYEAIDKPDAAVANYDLWLRYHPADATRPSAFNGRCWARALLNKDIDKAIDDCNQAVRLLPSSAAYLDSRGFAYFRKGDMKAAIRDLSSALTLNPNLAWSRYVRGLAEIQSGQADQGKQDIDAALAANPGLHDRGVRLGLEKPAGS